MSNPNLSVCGECKGYPGCAAFDCAHALPLSIQDYIRQQKTWSQRTFGDSRRTIGICKHIEKELAEIQSAPGDLFEWVDVIILALDGAWRAGFNESEIWDVMRIKQRRNFAREWPKPGPDDEPTEHIRKETK